jgi:2-oxo-4-hydroxy-4-carboxy--5-ureidoimidazoline (OHCU) decarboxylase
VAVDRSEIARIFEHAPVLVERLGAEAPFATREAFLTRARTYLDGMSVSERIAVLNAHPRVGAEEGGLSDDSRREQGGPESAAVRRDLAELNDRYERKFGFRFVVFVAGRPKATIVPVLRERLERTRDQELATAVNELMAIARDRLGRT